MKRMGLFQRRSRARSKTPPASETIDEALATINRERSRFNALAHRIPGMRATTTGVVIRIACPPAPNDATPPSGSRIVRTARIFMDRVELYDGDQLMARFDGAATVEVFAAEGS
jgi:hypothetical protein